LSNYAQHVPEPSSRRPCLSAACSGESPKRNAVWLCSVSRIVDKFALEDSMAQEHKPGEIVPKFGIYIIRHDPVHTGNAA
jgi:hypothetical protein